MLSGDVWTVRSWGLLHHAGILTHAHHDAEGALTWAGNLFGEKNWVVLFFKNPPPREQLAEFLTQLSDPKKRLREFADRIEAQTLHVHPGDLMYVVIPLFLLLAHIES